MYSEDYFHESSSDTTCLDAGEHVQLANLTGPWSTVYLERETGKLVYGRDCFGRRSLLECTTDSGRYLSSTAISIALHGVTIQNWQETIKAGEIYEISPNSVSPSKRLQLQPAYEIVPDPENLLVTSQMPSLEAPGEFYQSTAECVAELLRNAVRSRIRINNTDWQKVSVFFSGGIDSVIIAFLLGALSPFQEIELVNVSFYTKHAGYDTPDRKHALDAYEELSSLLPDAKFKLSLPDISVDELDDHRASLAAVLFPRITILDESIGAALYFLAKSAKHRIVFSGLGADELFGGYRRHLKAQDLAAELKLDITRIGERNLARDDRVIALHGKEVRLPFLDEQLVNDVTALSARARVRPDIPDGSKFLLRVIAFQCFKLRESARRTKQAMQFGCRSAKAANQESHKSIRAADKTVSPKLQACLNSPVINTII